MDEKKLIEAGFPASLVLTEEQRKSSWVANPPKPMPKFSAVQSSSDQETLKLWAAEAEKIKINKKAKPEAIDRTGQRWDPRKAQWVNETERQGNKMISITTNTRGTSKMTAPKAYSDMSMAELVEIYNKSSGKPPIKKFETRTLGLKRLEQLELNGAIKEVKAANKPIVAAEKPSKAPKVEKAKVAGIVGEFGFRENSPREKLLVAFNESLNKMVPVEQLASKVLGSKSVDNVKMIDTLLAGITWRIKVSKLAYEVKKEKGEGSKSLGLFKKK